MFYHLPPVGHPIQFRGCQSDSRVFGRAVAPYQFRFFASGTASLAAAIQTAISRKQTPSRPEVLLPAYACPDLISAVLFAGARPVLVDLIPDRPWMDLSQLERKLSANTVAVIAVNFLGILERHADIRERLENRNVLLIEDSAQAFPRKEESDFWQGDLVVVSFGRGKPVSLLGGGALLFQEDIAPFVPSSYSRPGTHGLDRAKFYLKATLYNLLIDPRWYWLPEALPGLRLGETRYHPLEALEGMAGEYETILACNLERYQIRPLTVQQSVQEKMRAFETKGRDIIDLPSRIGLPATRALLRYPVLVPAEDREAVIQAMQGAGMGASRLYPSALPSIPGVDNMPEISGEFPVAEDFARRLVTLPTHGFVSVEDIQTQLGILENYITRCECYND